MYASAGILGAVNGRLSGGVGLGHRPEIAVDLLTAPETVDFVEVVAESCFSQKELRREALALSRRWPVIPHGVKLSLGSADGIDEARAKRLGALTRELDAPLVSEHVSFTRGGTHEIGHLTQLPRSREAVRVLARNVARARRFLPDVPLLLENVAFSFAWPDDEMDEATFYREVVAATGCDLLLDVGNLYANAVNEGLDPARVLAAYPLDRIAMLHVAGGVLECGFYYDTHAHPISDAVYALVEQAVSACPGVPILLERDAGFGAFAELAAEVARLRAARSAPHRAAEPSVPTQRAENRVDLLALQIEVARLLTDPESVTPPRGALAARLGAVPLARSRAILARKRVDDALPLLARLGRHASLRALAERVTAASARAPSGAGPADALRIAEAAAGDPSLREDALVDALLLRARFAGPDAEGRVAPRVAPYLGATTLGDGTRLRVRKGFGAFAPLRTTERKAA